METALKHWLLHIEYPHSRSEWASEASQMMHDHFFWGMVAVGACMVFMVGLVLWTMATGTPTATPTMHTPVSWPFAHPMP